MAGCPWYTKSAAGARIAGHEGLLAHLLAFRFAHHPVDPFLRWRFPMVFPWSVDRSPRGTGGLRRGLCRVSYWLSLAGTT